jgi:hypothetical protein
MRLVTSGQIRSVVTRRATEQNGRCTLSRFGRLYNRVVGMRYLILIHRYLGTAVGILMIIWCLTGIVMMYVRYPELSPAERLQRLQPLRWQGCCQIGAMSLPQPGSIEAFQIENLGARPVLHLQLPDGPARVIDLTDGHPIAGITAAEAAAVAQAATPQTPRLLDRISYDEWTVSGEFDGARPLYRFALDDPAGTQLYVSSKSGRIMQITTANLRFWNWLGTVPHWLYFTQLRRQPALWSRVVIGTALAGCFLTALGLYIGVRQFLRRPAGRWSAYRGVLYWHHVPGLIFGVFALTWVASGLISMNPWGFLDRTSLYPKVDALIGAPTSGSDVNDALRTLAALPLTADVVAVSSSWLWGQPYLIESHRDGSRVRVHLDGSPAPLTPADWQRVGQTLSGKAGPPPELLTDGDAYYRSRPGVTARLPVYRLILEDAQHTRFYLDPVTGGPIEAMDSDTRWYRWLHRGLHTLDFAAVLRVRPLWDVLMIVLLAGVTGLCATGTWLGWRRYLRFGPR